MECPKCGEAVEADHAFCENCGAKLRGDAVRKRVARRTGKWARHHEQSTLKSVMRARIVILVVAALMYASALLLYFTFKSMFRGSSMPAVIIVIFAVQALLGFAYLCFFFWARHNPFAATLTALILYITIQLAGAALEPMSLFQGWFIKAVIIIALAIGVQSGLSYRRLKAKGRL